MKKLSLLLALCLLLGVLAGCGGEEKINLEGTISATSTYYQLDNAMLTYMLYDFIGQYEYYLVYYYGMQSGVDLREQNQAEGVTWFDYLMNNYIKRQAEEMVAIASMARASGITLTAEDQKQIQTYMQSFLDYVKEEGYDSIIDYTDEVYAKGITEEAIVRCLELELLASNYYNQVRDSFTYTAEQLLAYANENKNDFFTVDYIYYIFQPTVPKDATAEEEAALLAASKTEAETLLNGITDGQSFKDAIVELEKAAESAAQTTAAETTAVGTTAVETTAAETTTDETTVPETEKPDEEYYKKYVVTGEEYFEGDFGEWAFDESRQVGDKTIIDLTSGTGENEKIVGYAVCYLTKTLYLDETQTRNVRHILLTKDVYGSEEAARIKAEEILEQYLAGERTAEAFGALAKQYSKDGSAGAGGLIENVSPGEMVTEFNDWMFDPARQVGDTGIVKTSYGYHVMYHAGDGYLKWQIPAQEAILERDYSAYLEAAIKSYPLTFDAAGLTQIPSK